MTAPLPAPRPPRRLGAGVLLVAVAAVACRQARAVARIDEPKSRDGFFWTNHDGFVWLHPEIAGGPWPGLPARPG